MSLDSDRPIGHPDGDLLGLAPFAHALARSLSGMNPRDGLTLAVEGAWGGGKSSALALAEREIRILELARLGAVRAQVEALAAAALDQAWAAQEPQRLVRIVRFNPWTWSGQDNLTRAFFAELSAQIGFRQTAWWKRSLGWVASKAKWLSDLTGPVLLYLGITAPYAIVGRKAADLAEALAKDERSLEASKTALANALREADGRVIVFIDDLDRLMPGEMRAMLSLVKSLGDLPNVIYVLAYDPQVLRQGLESERVEPGFVAKIVQVTLTLPPPRRQDTRKLFEARLAAATDGAAFADDERWAHILSEAVEHYLRTPRDVARLANAVQVHWAAVNGEVDLADLVALTTLRLFEPKVYRLIEEENERLVGVELPAEIMKDVISVERLNKADAQAPKAARAALAALYPALARPFKEERFAIAGGRSLPRAHRRVCVAGHHRAYFAFAPDPLTPRRAEIDAIVEAADPAAALAALADMSRDDYLRAYRVLAEVEAQLHRGPLLSDALMSAVIDTSDALLVAARLHGVFPRMDLLTLLSNIIREGCRQLDASTRAARLERLMNGGRGLTLRVRAVTVDAEAYGLITGGGRGGEPLFDRDAIAEAMTALAAEITTTCSGGSLWSAPIPIYLVELWQVIAGRDVTARWVATLPDNRLAAWATAALSGVRAREIGASQEMKVFRREPMQEIFEVEAFLERLAAHAQTDEDAAAALAELKEAEKNAAHF